MFENVIENFLYARYFGKIATLQWYCIPDANLVGHYTLCTVFQLSASIWVFVPCNIFVSNTGP